MLFGLSTWLSSSLHFLRVFQYLTFRTIAAALIAFLIVLYGMPRFIKWIQDLRIRQEIRELGPQSHYKKQGTPTMGGLLIIFSVLVAVLLFGDLENRFVLWILGVMIAFGWIGGVDDYRKVVKRNSDGLSARWKFLLQSLAAAVVVVGLYMTARTPSETQLLIPFAKNVVIPLGGFYLVWAYIVIVGTSNAVNLTDGLDGLAIMPVVLVAGGLGLFAYLAGNHLFAHYLTIPYIAGAGELSVFCGALMGAGLGFLWYNAYPAEIFMGDVGSLGLGAVLGALALMVRQELVFFIMSGVFVAETCSVMLQVGYYKITKKRIFRMAPLHHHFELKGWPEPKVIVRFWIVTVILMLIALSSLKLR